MSISYLSLGSNIGNRLLNIISASKHLLSFSKILKQSSIYETSPVGYKHQPNFYNCVFKIELDIGPYTLLKKLKTIEKRIGRTKTKKWGKRKIDIDILFYNNSVINTNTLVIPHKELPSRKFVLKPFFEIDRDFRHPIFKKNINQMSNRLRDNSQEIKLIKKRNNID